MLFSFPSCNPFVKTRLLSSFCLSLYGSALWFSSAPALRPLETIFNNVLRRIWDLPRTCHTSILHCIAQLESMYSIIIRRSANLVTSALQSESPFLKDIFVMSQNLTFTSVCYNAHFSFRHRISYSLEDNLHVCTQFIRDVKDAPKLNTHLFDDIIYVHMLITNLTN